MTAYYNENDPFAAQWLRNLVAEHMIAPGDVDERSIEDVSPDDLRGYTQCHFFAGIGVWSYALRLACWPDDRPVWTGSCPCQPFSAAGKRGGVADERHLWPAWFWLIEQYRPSIVLGEQVASKDGLGWLDLVQADLEGAGYAVGAVDTCSAGSGAPHIRQRLRFVAERLEHAAIDGREQWRPEPGERSLGARCVAERLAHHHHHPRLEGRGGESERRAERSARAGSVDGGLAEPHGQRAESRPGNGGGAEQTSTSTGSEHWHVSKPRDARETGGLADADCAITEFTAREGPRPGKAQGAGPLDQSKRHGADSGASTAGPTNGFWRDADWLFCRDGKWRPVESGTFPLAHGAPSRVGRLRAYGNAVDAQATKHFIQAYRETTGAP